MKLKVGYKECILYCHEFEQEYSIFALLFLYYFLISSFAPLNIVLIQRKCNILAKNKLQLQLNLCEVSLTYGSRVAALLRPHKPRSKPEKEPEMEPETESETESETKSETESELSPFG